MRTFLHRFYDLYSGGGEVVLLSFVRAFPEDRHILVFNNYAATWVSAELESRANVRGIRVDGRDIGGIVASHRPDVILWHWYPPMSAEDMLGLPADVLQRSILYNHWYTELPFVPEIREYWFMTKTSLAETGCRIPPEMTRQVLNPVRAEFFDVRLHPEAALSVGRHSRPVGIKFSADFFQLYEGIDVPNLQVRVLGSEPALVTALQNCSHRLRHTYWLLPSNSMPVARFLPYLRVYIYKTHDSFHETCPVSILEALASGIPVAAENKGGIRDRVVPGETGTLCDTLEEYHRAAHLLLTSNEQWQPSSWRARQWALDNVSPDAYRRNCEQLLARRQ
jgi:glycosyltransferase involved in cell wall biosynthesis